MVRYLCFRHFRCLMLLVRKKTELEGIGCVDKKTKN